MSGRNRGPRNRGPHNKPTVERLRELFTVGEDGSLIRRIAVGRHGCRPAGSKAGSATTDGYLQVEVDGYPTKVHRVVYAIVHGVWPSASIDHIDGNPSNNRPENLRDVPHRTNMENRRRPQVNNLSGFLGVSLNRTGGKYNAKLKTKGVIHLLGSYATPEEAHAVYLNARRRLVSGNTL